MSNSNHEVTEEVASAVLAAVTKASADMTKVFEATAQNLRRMATAFQKTLAEQTLATTGQKVMERTEGAEVLRTVVRRLREAHFVDDSTQWAATARREAAIAADAIEQQIGRARIGFDVLEHYVFFLEEAHWDCNSTFEFYGTYVGIIRELREGMRHLALGFDDRVI